MIINYPWLKVCYYNIIKQYRYGKHHHALLINTIPGMGEDILISNISRWLMCKTNKSSNSCCGYCYDCQLMHANNHPDWYCFKIYQKIKLDEPDVQDLLEKISSCCFQASKKIVYLPNIADLNEIAAYSLLKILEDPPVNTYFFLINNTQSSLAHILLSRCVKMYLNPPSETEGFNWIKNHNPHGTTEQIIISLRMKDNGPIAALSLLKNEKFWHMRKMMHKVIPNALKNDIFLLLPILNNEDVLLNINCLISLLMDAMKYNYRITNNYINFDYLEYIKAIAKYCSINCLLKISKLWLQVHQYLTQIPTLNREFIIIDKLLIWEQMLPK